MDAMPVAAKTESAQSLHVAHLADFVSRFRMTWWRWSMETVQAVTPRKAKTAASIDRGKPKCLPSVLVVMFLLLRLATPHAPPSIEQRLLTSVLTRWRFSSMVSGFEGSRRSLRTSGDVGVTAVELPQGRRRPTAMVVGCAVGPLVAIARSARGPESVVGVCWNPGGAAAAPRRCRLLSLGPRPRAPRATPDPWPDGPLRARSY